jgi:hypothetical protein
MSAIGKPQKVEGPTRAVGNPNAAPNPRAIPVTNWPTTKPAERPIPVSIPAKKTEKVPA